LLLKHKTRVVEISPTTIWSTPSGFKNQETWRETLYLDRPYEKLKLLHQAVCRKQWDTFCSLVNSV